jgi:hypothetical protein
MQNPLSVTLPGGLHEKGVLQRHAEFKPLTGRIEQSIYSSSLQSGGLPVWISEILSSALHCIGNTAVDAAKASALCVADRQFLMLSLARMVSGDRYWLQGKCKQCSKKFDVRINQAELPVQKAGRGFPFVSVSLARHTISLRISTGGDQQEIQGLSQDAAIKTLLDKCIVAIKPETNHARFVDNLSDTDTQAIDDALDRVSPSIGTLINTECPECHASQVLEFDPYHLIQQQSAGLYHDVHRIAYYYHWSEQEILSLPKARRQLYLRMIDATQGVHG